MAATADLFARHAHPYTTGLLRSMPSLEEDGLAELSAIPGMAAGAGQLPPGCAFRPRCDQAFAACHDDVPQLIGVGPAMFGLPALPNLIEATLIEATGRRVQLIVATPVG